MTREGRPIVYEHSEDKKTANKNSQQYPILLILLFFTLYNQLFVINIF